jgi:hypothetical protein
MARLNTSARTIAQCHVRIVNATINNSVNMSDVKVIATTWINSSSNNKNAPYIIIPPEKYIENHIKGKENYEKHIVNVSD